MKRIWTLTLAHLLFFSLSAQEKDTSVAELTEEQYLALFEYYLDSVSNSLSYGTGTITLKGSLATLTVPEGFKYLNAKDSKMVLEDLWGNPPSEDEPSLGMLFSTHEGPNSDSSFAINITYSEEGYIDDSDAKSIDYDDLLETMQEDAVEVNELRKEMGYETVELIGWASAPFYDGTQKKLHWAKELKFGESVDHTLNYNIRVLGRKGYLQMNVIGEMAVFPEVQSTINAILPAVAFNEGNRYDDFNPDIDEVAAYGIGGLIAGKVLAKTGILATIGLFLAKFWKFLAIGAVAFFSGFKRFFRKKESPKVEDEASQERPEENKD
ncbi:MAG: DUF2167 domain-containing protein [Bacteroidota bacterium]